MTVITGNNDPLFEELGYTEELYKRRISNSQFLLIAAWLLEIVAASIGAFIAVLTIYTAIDQVSPDNITRSIQLNAYLGGLPFIMVAIVELMKIPLVTAAFHSKNTGWKIFFTVSLVLVAVITFETALNGFQRNFQIRMLEVDDVKNEIVTLEDQVSLLEQERQDIESIDSSGLNQRQDELRQQANSEIETLNLTAEIASGEAQAQYGGGALTSNENRLEDINEELVQLVGRRDTDLARIQEQYTNDRQSEAARYQIRLDSNDENLAEAGVTRQSAIDACRGLFQGQCVDDAELAYVERRDELSPEALDAENRANVTEIGNRRDEAIAAVEQNFDSVNETLRIERVQLTGEISTQSNEDRNILNTVLARIDANLETEIVRVRETLALDVSQITDQLQAQSTRQEELNNTIDETDDLNNQLIERRREFDSVANADQIYQIAKLVFNARSASEITEEQIRLVVFIWFGSLAAIVACTGIVLALGSMVLRYEPMQTHASLLVQIGRILFYIFDFLKYLPRTLRSFRNLIVTYRKRLKKEPKIVEKKVIVKEIEYVEKSVEVVREVPVEKVVVKHVEKPVTVVKKEFVYIPFYTDDPAERKELERKLAKIESGEKAQE